MSPDGQVYGFVLLDQGSGEPTNSITVIDLRPGGETRTFPLVAPATEGVTMTTIKYADAMDFTLDNRMLVYDAYSILELQDGTKIGVWSIYGIDLITEEIFSLISPVPDADVGFPSLGQTNNHLITFDAVDASMSIERQQKSFRLLKGLIEADYRFTDKDAARDLFTKITGVYKNLNYSPEESQEYQRSQKEIADLAAEYSIGDADRSDSSA